MKLLYFWFFIVIAVLILILSFGNSSSVTPVYIFFSITQTSLTWIMLAMGVIGFFAGLFFGLYFTSKQEDSPDTLL